MLLQVAKSWSHPARLQLRPAHPGPCSWGVHWERAAGAGAALPCPFDAAGLAAACFALKCCRGSGCAT